jgi:hypothetical protein
MTLLHHRDALAVVAVLALTAGCSDRRATMSEADSCAGGKCDDLGTDTDTDTDGASGSGPGSRDSDPHSACESSGTGGGSESSGTGAAEPWDPAEAEPACEERKREAFNPNRGSFQHDFMRWSCADVDGRHPTERGQEYCEYFAIVQLPDGKGNLGDAHVLGLNQGEDLEDGQTPFGVELEQSDVDNLDADPYSVVGQCVFTSWNGDIEAERLPEREIQGVPLGADVFRMKYFANTVSAAQCLIEECLEYLPPHDEAASAGISLDDDFTRGCFLNSFRNETQDRKSDSIICSSAMRLAECGCGLTTGGQFSEALSPADVLGFRLGSWEDDDAAFGPCEFVDLGDGQHNVVTCPLTAHEVLNHAAELKAYCQDTYADEIVVHVDVAAQAVLCTPDPEIEPYATTCSSTPWVVQE